MFFVLEKIHLPFSGWRAESVGSRRATRAMTNMKVERATRVPMSTESCPVTPRFSESFRTASTGFYKSYLEVLDVTGYMWGL